MPHRRIHLEGGGHGEVGGRSAPFLRHSLYPPSPPRPLSPDARPSLLLPPPPSHALAEGSAVLAAAVALLAAAIALLAV